MPAQAASPAARRKKNSKSWRKGQSGNPSGQPKNIETAETIAGWRERVNAYIRTRTTAKQVFEVLEAMRTAALEGNVPAACVWLDRAMGKVEAKLSVEAVHAIAPDQIRSAIETLTRLGFADMVPPALAVVAESPAVPIIEGVTMPQDQSQGGPS